MKRHFLQGQALFSILLLVCGYVHPADIITHAGSLIDGDSVNAGTKVSFHVRDDRIVSVDQGFKTIPGAEIIDLSGATLMPGFIDTQVHIAAQLPSRTNATQYSVTHPDINRALDGAMFARQMLRQGFTGAAGAE